MYIYIYINYTLAGLNETVKYGMLSTLDLLGKFLQLFNIIKNHRFSNKNKIIASIRKGRLESSWNYQDFFCFMAKQNYIILFCPIYFNYIKISLGYVIEMSTQTLKISLVYSIRLTLDLSLAFKISESEYYTIG